MSDPSRPDAPSPTARPDDQVKADAARERVDDTPQDDAETAKRTEDEAAQLGDFA